MIRQSRDYKSLGPYGQKVFEETYAAHMASMGTEKRKQYSMDQIAKLRANNNERCIEVYFKNGEFFKYTPHRTWH